MRIGTIVIITAANLYAQFGWGVDSGLVEYDSITEASGIAASQRNSNLLWINNDSGDKNRIYSLRTNGKHVGVHTLAGCPERDWEDIAVGPGPGDSFYIFVGNIGDNSAAYDVKFIYRIPEPYIPKGQIERLSDTLRGCRSIAFKYPDGRRDAETLMVDPISKDLVIVSKREKKVIVYLAKYPQSLDTILTLTALDTLALSNVTGGDISPDGSEILLKTYTGVYYWKREPGESIKDAFAKDMKAFNYLPEPQGEAICWNKSATGYFTVSEESKNIPARLYFYQRQSVSLQNK